MSAENPENKAPQVDSDDANPQQAAAGDSNEDTSRQVEQSAESGDDRDDANHIGIGQN